MATATYFNIHEILEANPSVGYKIQHSEQGPRVVLFTNHFGTSLDDCIDVALNVAKAHRLAVGSAQRHGDTLHHRSAQLGGNCQHHGAVWRVADERWLRAISSLRQAAALSGAPHRSTELMPKSARHAPSSRKSPRWCGAPATRCPPAFTSAP